MFIVRRENENCIVEYRFKDESQAREWYEKIREIGWKPQFLVEE